MCRFIGSRYLEWRKLLSKLDDEGMLELMKRDPWLINADITTVSLAFRDEFVKEMGLLGDLRFRRNWSPWFENFTWFSRGKDPPLYCAISFKSFRSSVLLRQFILINSFPFSFYFHFQCTPRSDINQSMCRSDRKRMKHPWKTHENIWKTNDVALFAAFSLSSVAFFWVFGCYHFGQSWSFRSCLQSPAHKKRTRHRDLRRKTTHSSKRF